MSFFSYFIAVGPGQKEFLGGLNLNSATTSNLDQRGRPKHMKIGMTANFSPWPMGFLFLVVVFPTILYEGWIQSLASHHPIVEGNGKNNCLPLFDNSIRYSTTQFWVEDGIPRTSLWHYHEQGLNPTLKWIRCFIDIWYPWRYDIINWEDAKVNFSLEEVHREFELKIIEIYRYFRERMLN